MPYESPNIVIVPTVSICGQSQERAKFDEENPAPPQHQLPADVNPCEIQQPDQGTTSIGNSTCIVRLDDELCAPDNYLPANIQENPFETQGDNPCEKANYSFSSEDRDKMVKKTLSWASNYLKSIGQSHPKVSKHHQSPAPPQQKHKIAAIHNKINLDNKESSVNYANRSYHFQVHSIIDHTSQKINKTDSVDNLLVTLETPETETNNIQKHIKINLLNDRNPTGGFEIDRAQNHKQKDRVTVAQSKHSETKIHKQKHSDNNGNLDNEKYSSPSTSKISDSQKLDIKYVERRKRAISPTAMNKRVVKCKYTNEKTNVIKKSKEFKTKPKIISKRHVYPQKTFNISADTKYSRKNLSLSANTLEKHHSPENSSDRIKYKTLLSSKKNSGRKEFYEKNIEKHNNIQTKKSATNKKKSAKITSEIRTTTQNKSVVQVIETFDVKESPLHKTDINTQDLRNKLKRKHYNYETAKCENLHIAVQNEKEEYNCKKKRTDKVTVTDSKPPKLEHEKKKFKKIKLVINLVCEKNPESSESENDGKNNEYPLANVDLSFLDDFNVDDIVDCLKSTEANNNINVNNCESLKITNESRIEIKKPISDASANNSNQIEADLDTKSIQLEPSFQKSKRCGSGTKIEQNTCNDRNLIIETQNCQEGIVIKPLFAQNDCNIHCDFQSQNKAEATDYKKNMQENTEIEYLKTNAASSIDRNEKDPLPPQDMDLVLKSRSFNINKIKTNGTYNNNDVEYLGAIGKNIGVITINDTEDEACSSLRGHKYACHKINNDGNGKNNNNIVFQCAENKCVSKLKEYSCSHSEIRPDITEFINLTTDEDQSRPFCETTHQPQNTEKPLLKTAEKLSKMNDNCTDVIDLTKDEDINIRIGVDILDTIQNIDATHKPTFFTSDGNKTQPKNEILDCALLANINMLDTSAKNKNDSFTKINLDFATTVTKDKDIITISEEKINTENSITNIIEINNNVKNDYITLACNDNESVIGEKTIIEEVCDKNSISVLEDITKMIKKHSIIEDRDFTNKNININKSIVKNQNSLTKAEKNTDIDEKTITRETRCNKNLVSVLEDNTIIIGSEKWSSEKNTDEINKNIITPQSIIKNNITIREEGNANILEKNNIKETRCNKKSQDNNNIKKIQKTEKKVVKKTSKGTERVIYVPVNKAYIPALNARMREKFSITSLISKGKFSKVFECKDSRGCTYALKVMHSRTISYREKEFMLKSIRRDIPKNNFHCIYLIDGFATLGQWCFLMEHFPNNLQIALAEYGKSFHINVVQKLSQQLISALVVLRNNNIAHLAIKPGHILINASNDRLKLAGFDEARFLTDIKLVPNYGTVNYRPPEVILGFPDFVKADVWSAALVMYEMATNRKLFPGYYNNDILYKQQSLLGEVPPYMLERSAYRRQHYHGTQFMRIIFKGKRVPVHAFNRRNKLNLSIRGAYDKEWALGRGPTERAADEVRLRQLLALLAKMLELPPAARLPVEFVYAHPFLYEPYLDYL